MGRSFTLSRAAALKRMYVRMFLVGNLFSLLALAGFAFPSYFFDPARQESLVQIALAATIYNMDYPSLVFFTSFIFFASWLWIKPLTRAYLQGEVITESQDRRLRLLPVIVTVAFIVSGLTYPDLSRMLPHNYGDAIVLFRRPQGFTSALFIALYVALLYYNTLLPVRRMMKLYDLEEKEGEAKRSETSVFTWLFWFILALFLYVSSMIFTALHFAHVGGSALSNSRLYGSYAIVLIAELAIVSVIVFLFLREVLRPFSAAVKTVSAFVNDVVVRKSFEQDPIPLESYDEVGRLLADVNKLSIFFVELFRQVDHSILTLSEVNSGVVNHISPVTQVARRLPETAEKLLKYNSELSSKLILLEKTGNNIYGLVQKGVDAVSHATSGTLEHDLTQVEAMHDELIKTYKDGAKTLSHIIEEARTNLSSTIDDIQGFFGEFQTPLEELISANTTVVTISEQVSILSINAGIEAAHTSSAQGDGFRLIASSMKNLAQSIAEQTELISNILSKYQATLSALDDVVKSGARGQESMRQSSESFDATTTRSLERFSKFQMTVFRGFSDQVRQFISMQEEIRSAVMNIRGGSVSFGSADIEADEQGVKLASEIQKTLTEMQETLLTQTSVVEKDLERSMAVNTQLKNFIKARKDEQGSGNEDQST